MRASRASTSTAPGLWAPQRRALTTGLVLATTFIATEALAVVTVMPRIAHDLGDLQLYGWAFSSFMLASVIGTVAAGRLADSAGPARPFTAGLALFVAGLLIAGLAPSMGVLVLGRAVQGLGAGAVPAVGYVAIGRGLEGPLQARMLAVLATAWVLPGLFGPILAAELARLAGWRWVFLGLVPLVALTGLLAVPALARLRTPRRDASGAHRLTDAVRVSVGGALALAAPTAHPALAALALAASGIAVGAPALRRLLPAGTLAARRGLPATVLSRGLLTFAFFGADAFVTLAVTTVSRHGTTAAGVVITGCTLAWTAGAWLQTRLLGSWEGRRLIRAGMALVLAGLAGMALSLRPSIPVAEAALAWSLAGFGMGLAYSPTSLMMLAEVPAGMEGWGSASLSLAEMVGIALGTGICGALITAVSAGGGPTAGALDVAFALAATAAVATIAVSPRLPGLASSRPSPAIGRLASQETAQEPVP